MAGIYIHIPFCRRKCHYCNFFSVASGRHIKAFTTVLLREIEQQQGYLGTEEVNTIYFGGGTPSLLPTDDISRIFDKIRAVFRVSSDAEVTLEANPDDLSEEKIISLSGSPVNRISIGVQSFFDEDLVYLNRVHDAGQAEACIRLAREHGFHNLTIDLIYGIPTLTDERWEQNLERFFSFGLPHLSAYALTVEPRTALHKLIEKRKVKAPMEKRVTDHFSILLEKTKASGFIHYEISNFSKEGFYSTHNSIYWLGGNYLGLGPSAHSYNGYSRQWNVSGMDKYMRLSDYRDIIEEKEVLSPEQKYNEYVMTSLRTLWGCDTVHIQNVFGDSYVKAFVVDAEKFIQLGRLERRGKIYFLTEEGKLFADGIAAEFFL